MPLFSSPSVFDPEVGKLGLLCVKNMISNIVNYEGGAISIN